MFVVTAIYLIIKPISMKKNKTYLMNCPIAGLKYYNVLDVWGKLKTGFEYKYRTRILEKGK
jgi:hypothetical protein